MSSYITLGSAKCPHSIRQSQSNAMNNVTTVFCDAALKDGEEPKTEIQKMCHNLRDGKYEGVQGVPANFSCASDITADNLLNADNCTVTTGFQEHFGKMDMFDQLDTNKDGVISREEFNA